MPELPEVEAARRAVEDNCVGKKIKKVIIADDTKVIDGVSRSEFEASLLGKTIVAARRKGKNMWLELDSPPFPSFQFGMAGAVYIKGVAVTKYKRSAVKDEDEWPSKYSKFFIELDDGLEMSFTDKRRFAKVRLLNDPRSVPPISELGPDTLFEPMTLEEFTESLHKKKTEIKALLLDQSFISGIGNWVADEVLYQARIHPRHVASNLSKENCSALHKCIKEVIHYAVEHDANSCHFPLEWLFHYRWGKKPGEINGKEYFSYIIVKIAFILQVIEKAVEVGADSSQYPTSWIFHSREKKPGKALVDGKKIEFITAGGRTTAYVPELQKLSGPQDVKEAGKPKRQSSKKKSGGNDDNDDHLEESTKEEENLVTLKPKKGTKARGKGGKQSKKKKSEESDDDEDEGDDDDDDDNNDDEDDQLKKKKPEQVNNSKQAKGKKVSKKRVQTSQNSKNAKRKVK